MKFPGKWIGAETWVKANSVGETVCLSGQNTHILRQETCGKDFIFMKILKNALFLTPLYFESNFYKCVEMPSSGGLSGS